MHPASNETYCIEIDISQPDAEPDADQIGSSDRQHLAVHFQANSRDKQYLRACREAD